MQTVWASRLGILRSVKFRSNCSSLGSVQLLHNFRLFERKFREWAAAHFRTDPYQTLTSSPPGPSRYTSAEPAAAEVSTTSVFRPCLRPQMRHRAGRSMMP
jgi:hypothetical protein